MRLGEDGGLDGGDGAAVLPEVQEPPLVLQFPLGRLDGLGEEVVVVPLLLGEARLGLGLGLGVAGEFAAVGAQRRRNLPYLLHLGKPLRLPAGRQPRHLPEQTRVLPLVLVGLL